MPVRGRRCEMAVCRSSPPASLPALLASLLAICWLRPLAGLAGLAGWLTQRSAPRTHTHPHTYNTLEAGQPASRDRSSLPLSFFLPSHPQWFLRRGGRAKDWQPPPHLPFSFSFLCEISFSILRCARSITFANRPRARSSTHNRPLAGLGGASQAKRVRCVRRHGHGNSCALYGVRRGPLHYRFLSGPSPPFPSKNHSHNN